CRAQRGADRRQHGRRAAGRRVPARTSRNMHGGTRAPRLRRGHLRVSSFGRWRTGFGGCEARSHVPRQNHRRRPTPRLGKTIGGARPVRAYGGRADLMDLVSPAGPVYQAGTLSGNPLAMTAGIWCLDHLTPRLYRDLAALGTRLAAGLADAARAADVPLQVNAFGSVLTPFFTDCPVRDYASAVRADTVAYAKFFRGMLSHGVYPPPSQFEAWFLSAAHTVKDVDRTIAAAREAMREI